MTLYPEKLRDHIFALNLEGEGNVSFIVAPQIFQSLRLEKTENIVSFDFSNDIKSKVYFYAWHVGIFHPVNPFTLYQ